MQTVKHMMLDGKVFSFGYSPHQDEFDKATEGTILTGKVANIVNIGPSLLRKAAGDQYIAESYKTISVQVVGETSTTRWEDKIVRKDGGWVNEGENIPCRILIVQPQSSV